VRRLLLNSDLPGARRQVARIVGRDTQALDEPEVTRAVIETLAESASDGGVAPMFYLAIGGAPAAALENCLKPVSLRSYPDSQAFVSALAERHGVDHDEIVIGPGSAALMFAVLRATVPVNALVLEPCFDEYFRACAAVEAPAARIRLTEESNFSPDFAELERIVETRQCDLLILNSPRNPTGRSYAREDLMGLLEVAEANDVAVLLDEAFIDYAPQPSLIHVAATTSRLIVLRSLTKFYAIPGLRVGYAVCSSGMAAKIRRQFDAWPVSTIALEAGRAALNEEEYEFARVP